MSSKELEAKSKESKQYTAEAAEVPTAVMVLDTEKINKELELGETENTSKPNILTTESEVSKPKESGNDSKSKVLNGTVPIKDHCTVLSEEPSATDICNLAGLPAYCKIVKAAIKMENQDIQPKKSRIDLASLPTRQYLDQTVVPILMNALSHLAKERPPEPIAALAAYLLKNRANFEQTPSENNSPPAEPEATKN
ncbi:hypothetical protein WA026_015553 [Henosepilachna vigintioctopunctata]|uniref:Dpy-30-like protein n=1 Tax=Henosepilachna vigintioctopunctata TaxID=420089 RepID=A0AAW1V8U3_9CUCU